MDLVEEFRWDYKTSECNWQLDIGLLAFGLEEIIFSCKANTFRSVSFNKKAKGCRY